jgi:hypothetical protein
MPLNSEVAKSLNYLRKRYKVSERDLVALAKKLQSGEEPEETWEEITLRTLRNRQGRFTRAKKIARMDKRKD